MKNALIFRRHAFFSMFLKKQVFYTFLKQVSTLYAYGKIITVFSLLWIIFSGNDDPLMVGCGIFAICFTFFLCIKNNIISPNSYIIKLTFVKYVYILLRDVVISSIQMIKIIFAEKLNINPGTKTINVSQLTDQEKVLFANLITMTPGTFVIAIEGDNFLIHALNKQDLDFKNNIEIKNLLRKMRNKQLSVMEQHEQNIVDIHAK